MSTGEKAKKGFKMPHLFWIMMGLLLFACLLTYIIPAGEFAVDENGKILGDQFSYLGHQNPVAPWRMFMLILPVSYTHLEYGTGMRGYGAFYDNRVYYFCKESQPGKENTFRSFSRSILFGK